MDSKKVVVVDRNGVMLCSFNKELPGDMTVEELKKELVKSCDKISMQFQQVIFNIGKAHGDINRVWLTIGEARGTALSDKKKTLS